MAYPNHNNDGYNHLQQLPIKRTTREFLKAARSAAFKNSLGLGLSAKYYKSASGEYIHGSNYRP
ncbi:MAG: hypothetical protein AUK48_09045 [Oscillatoriales cyanobacterium CG2_30_44_21]|nr:MAG: hypothetical protein AUK48_09045 [Oscillatoriales cyanobacterium CG2_30_44_21]